MSERYVVIPNTKPQGQWTAAYVVCDTECVSGSKFQPFIYNDIGPIQYSGTKAQCERYAFRRNMDYAKKLMTQGTAAEGL